MRALVADDDPLTRHLLKQYLTTWGYAVTEAADGGDAWAQLQRPDRPGLVLLDWMMPKLDGPEICRLVRAAGLMPPPYIILITGRERPEDIVGGLDAGADDYLVKPVHHAELRARVGVGARMAKLQGDLLARVRELEAAQAHVRQLQEIIPICATCKKIRDDAGAYHQMEAYISRHSNVAFSHGLCPECEEKLMRMLDAEDARPS